MGRGVTRRLTPQRWRWAPLLWVALLFFAPANSSTARHVLDALGVFPLQWWESLPPEQAANVCLEWAETFRALGDEENTEALRLDAMNRLARHRSLTPATYDAWLRAFPDHPFLLNDAAWTCLIAEGNAEAAHALLLRVPPARRTAAHLDTLACTLLRLGRPADALQAILQALEQEENITSHTCLLMEHLGDALFANGFRRDALTAWRAARHLARLHLDGAPIDTLLPEGYDDTRLLLKVRALRRLLPKVGTDE